MARGPRSFAPGTLRIGRPSQSPIDDTRPAQFSMPLQNFLLTDFISTSSLNSATVCLAARMSMLSFASEHHEAVTLLFLDRGSRPLQIGGVRSARLLHDYARLRAYENFRICRVLLLGFLAGG